MGSENVKLFNLTARFDKTPGALDAPPPRLSAHTDEVLEKAGYTKEEIKKFREKKII